VRRRGPYERAGVGHLSSILAYDRLRGIPGAGWAGRSRRLRRLAARLGVKPPNPRPVAPATPVGVKLELTHNCNLRCGFCYTDSPRRTLERIPELGDDDWRAVVEEAIGLGVVEAVLTGCEPLLRKELALELFELLAEAGVAVTFNTNGWFLDAATADRLAAAGAAVDVRVSLDGATPELHDRARGVPGSWGRAVRALALLAERGVATHVVHVLTPESCPAVEGLVEQAWLLGARSVALTPVVPVGAAARGGRWQIDVGRVRRIVRRAGRVYGPEMPIVLAPEVQTEDPVLAPASVVVRPTGAVMAGSLTPFRFGHARRDGLAASWRRIARDWDHEHVRAWRAPILRGEPIAAQGLVLYRDEEPDVDQPLTVRSPKRDPVALPRLPRSLSLGGVGDLPAALRQVRSLALARPHRRGAVRFAPLEGDERYVRTADGKMVRLNRTAAMVMDACDGGTPADALARIASGSWSVRLDRAELERQVLDAVRRLVSRGILRPALAPEALAPEAPARLGRSPRDPAR
jgi:MoaA/NifB/PqqE/SkfB family radical SAM enzyme